MDGESLLVLTLKHLVALPTPPVDVLKESIVTVATLYKNAFSIASSSLTLCTEAIQSLMTLMHNEMMRENDQVVRKLFYALSVITNKYPAMGEFFLQNNGVVVLEQAVASSSDDMKRRALQMYRQLFQQFTTLPSLSTINVCSQCMEDLTDSKWRENIPLLEAYAEFLRVAKEHGERGCLEQLLQSDVFMKEVKERYENLREKAREGRCDGWRRVMGRNDGRRRRGLLHQYGEASSQCLWRASIRG